MITNTEKEVWNQVKGTCGSLAEMKAGIYSVDDGKQQRLLEQGEKLCGQSTPGSPV